MSKLVLPALPLQELDLEIHSVKEERDEKPGQLAAYAEKKDRAQSNVETIHEEIKKLKLEGSKRELEVKEMDARIEKLTIQSNTAKKNDEYHAFLKEISGVKADRSRLEDGLLDIYMQADEKVKLEKIRVEEQETAGTSAHERMVVARSTQGNRADSETAQRTLSKRVAGADRRRRKERKPGHGVLASGMLQTLAAGLSRRPRCPGTGRDRSRSPAGHRGSRSGSTESSVATRRG